MDLEIVPDKLAPVLVKWLGIVLIVQRTCEIILANMNLIQFIAVVVLACLVGISQK